MACAMLSTLGIRPAISQTILQSPKTLASETFDLTEEMEVGLEIDARSPGASWSRKGAEAAALLISVDGAYNQDLLLWAGDESFPYRVMLGRFPRGKHTISVTLNPARSAAGAQRAEVKSLRPLLFATSRGANGIDDERFAMSHAPVLYARANTIDRFTDVPLVMYYEILREAGTDLTVRYTAIFTNEDGGTQTAALMARWGRATDIEWVYQFRVRDQKITEEIYQGVEHETKSFTGTRATGSHPLLAIASDNNNFSDLACSAVRFAPLPVRARLETATRESVMDMYPQTYRVMTEELLRENRISDAPADINTIVDPREYLYIEAVSEQTGTALAFDVKVTGQPKIFASDMGEPRLRIDRSGYFRTAVRLAKGVSPAMIESITARCHEGTKPAAVRNCKHLKVVRTLMLDQNFVPRPILFQTQPESSLAPGETMVLKLAQPKP
ncbi:MAG: hypothetical protein MSG64_13345 [Pyrinomonadaceae bacterium MAG19_C2-C3]|nr:hypothetical protein [Pyrinomonadaceae bacterium MAG19_C2-C3]